MTETPTCDIAIVGGGAAGLAAAIFAAEHHPHLDVRVLDGAQRLGAKILVAGGGRCNFTHQRVRPDDYHAPRPVVRNVLAAFNERDAAAWIESLGVPLKTEPTGKLFPVSDQARSVLDALMRRCEQLGVKILTGHRVEAVTQAEAGFELRGDGWSLRSRKLVLATGGKSLPRTGSDGAGYGFATALGHTVTDTAPALAPMVLKDNFFHAELSGISHEVTLETFVDNKLTDRRTGSLLWTHFGISGPVVMDASRFWIIARAHDRQPSMRLNLLIDASFDQADRWLVEAAAGNAKRKLVTLLAERLQQRVAMAAAQHAGVDPDQALGQLTRDSRRKLVHALVGLELPVLRDRGWNYAEVTAGGVPLSEVDHRTMQSRRTPGLYLVGEILDCDGRIGGFNFQWAWSTGYLAGRAVGG